MNAQQIEDFITAGHSTFTITSERTNRHFTYHCTKPLGEENREYPVYIRVLTGPDNTNDFTYIGIIGKSGKFVLSRNSVDLPDQFRAFSWFWQNISNGNLPTTVSFEHAGKCGRCGRLLTTPESIARGLGPICAEKSA